MNLKINKCYSYRQGHFNIYFYNLIVLRMSNNKIDKNYMYTKRKLFIVNLYIEIYIFRYITNRKTILLITRKAYELV